jgi:hypothetical protein
MSTAQLLALLLLFADTAGAADAPHYTVRFDRATGNAAVRLCLGRAHPAVRFLADSPSAMPFVHRLQRDDAGTLVVGDGAWTAPAWPAGACLTYQADLAAIARTQQDDVGFAVGGDLVTAPQLWLLRPDVQDDADAELTLELPSGGSVSAPWTALGPPRALDRLRFRIPNTPRDWAAVVAFGRFAEQPIELPGGTLRVTILRGADAAQRQRLSAWLGRVARAILAAYGRLPLADVQVLVIPLPGRGRAVWLGQSLRGEGNALELLVDPTRPANEFAADWIAVHELSHLLHPYLGDSGSWLAEGLATYYQNVLRGRVGLLRPAQAWDRLRAGFAETDGQRYATTLAEAAAAMPRSHDYERVYWSGAVYWLSVDRDLRRHGQSLDQALAAFRDCCLPAYREWSPESFVTRLDQLTGSDIFTRRYREFATLRRFPEWQSLFADLGIEDAADGLRFDSAAPDARLRDAILPPARAVEEEPARPR